MPSIKALLLTLFLAVLALLIIAVFVKKSKSVQDAEIYAKQNPNCSAIKIHSNKNSLVECFLNFESASDISLTETDTLYASMVKFMSERFPKEFPLRVRHVFSIPDEITDSIDIQGNSISISKGKNSAWHNTHTGCKFPGPCPTHPLRSINKGKDTLNAISAILPGKIIKINKEDFYSITIYHGENIYSQTGGILNLSEYTKLGKTVSPDSILGFLPPKNSKYKLEITRNGKLERWL